MKYKKFTKYRQLTQQNYELIIRKKHSPFCNFKQKNTTDFKIQNLDLLKQIIVEDIASRKNSTRLFIK